MPSDERFAAALMAVAPERAAFRSALAATLEQVRSMVAAGTHYDTAQERLMAELGAFAVGRIQVGNIPLGKTDGRYRKTVINSIRHSQQILTASQALGDDLHFVDVEPGGNLERAVVEALAMAGRTFAAAQLLELIREGRDQTANDEMMLLPVPPARWLRAERTVAPPLIVRVDGADLSVNGIADLLQGKQKIILLVDGLAPPAALARLITPGVFVMQCRSVDDLGRMSAAETPGIAAVLNEPASIFTADHGQLDIAYLTKEEPRRALKAASVFRQREDLAWLRELARMRAAVTREAASAESAGTSAEPADKLAAWLLQQIEKPNSSAIA